MKRCFLFVFLMCIGFSLDAQNEGLRERLERHVYTFASDSLLGREAGSIYSMKAAEYIIRNFEEIGIKPYVGDSTYFQLFKIGDKEYYNVVGYIEGSDPVLKDEIVVFGAHYDHLGFRVRGNDTIVYSGADDNASGTAALIEIARQMKEREGELSRTVLFAAFDAEEIGLYGSRHLASVSDPEKVKFMISMDMVGWLSAGKALTIVGTGTIKNGNSLMRSIPEPPGLTVKLKKFDKMVMGDSDHSSFADRGIPNFYASTGVKSPYHKPEDTAEKIDYDGMVLITDYFSSMGEIFATDPEFAPSGRQGPKHQIQRFELGLTASIGSNAHHYTEGPLTGKSKFSWGAGLMMQVNMGSVIALRPEVIYQQRGARYPNYQINELMTTDKYRLNSVTVPLNLIVKLPMTNMAYFYLSAGGYYSYNFGGITGDIEIDFENDIMKTHRDEWGWGIGFGVNLGPIGLEYRSLKAITPLQGEGDKILNRANYFGLYYKF